jgi:hypothetical protein
MFQRCVRSCTEWSRRQRVVSTQGHRSDREILEVGVGRRSTIEPHPHPAELALGFSDLECRSARAPSSGSRARPLRALLRGTSQRHGHRSRAKQRPVAEERPRHADPGRTGRIRQEAEVATGPCGAGVGGYGVNGDSEHENERGVTDPPSCECSGPQLDMRDLPPATVTTSVSYGHITTSGTAWGSPSSQESTSASAP